MPCGLGLMTDACCLAQASQQGAQGAEALTGRGAAPQPSPPGTPRNMPPSSDILRSFRQLEDLAER